MTEREWTEAGFYKTPSQEEFLDKLIGECLDITLLAEPQDEGFVENVCRKCDAVRI